MITIIHNSDTGLPLERINGVVTPPIGTVFKVKGKYYEQYVGSLIDLDRMEITIRVRPKKQ